jgi:glycosyltransferase involved in cell wall biosynthesis
LSRKILIIVASDSIVGGHSVQARELQTYFAGKNNFSYKRFGIDSKLPGFIKKIKFLRTVINEAFYLLKLLPNICWANILHIFSASYWSFLLGPAPALLIGKLFKKKVILNYHSGEADDHLTRWRRVVKPIIRLADEIVVPSEYLKEIFARHGFSARVISNSIDLQRFVMSRNVSLSNDTLKILCTRNFEAHYRVDLVIDAFREVKNRVPDATLTLIGDGSQRGQLEQLVQQHGLRGVRFVGSVANSEIHKFYQNANLYMNASVVDNMPLSLMEAMASGLLVVSSDAGGIPYFIKNDHNGILVPCNNPMALANATIKIYRDRDRWNRIQANALQDSQAFGSDVVCRSWEKLYAQLS